jgi:hypothetical protein
MVPLATTPIITKMNDYGLYIAPILLPPLSPQHLLLFPAIVLPSWGGDEKKRIHSYPNSHNNPKAYTQGPCLFWV